MPPGRPPRPPTTHRIEITTGNHGVTYDARDLSSGRLLVEGSSAPGRSAARVLLHEKLGKPDDILEVYRAGVDRWDFRGTLRWHARYDQASMALCAAEDAMVPSGSPREISKPGAFFVFSGVTS